MNKKKPIGYRSRLAEVNKATKKLTVIEIARRIGVTRMTVYKWINPDNIMKKPDSEVLQALGKLYGFDDPFGLLIPVYNDKTLDESEEDSRRPPQHMTTEVLQAL